MCPRCLARYFRVALEGLRRRFSLAKVLDDPCLAERFFEHVDAAGGLDLVEVRHTVRPTESYDISQFRRALLTSTATRPVTVGALAAAAKTRVGPRPFFLFLEPPPGGGPSSSVGGARSTRPRSRATGASTTTPSGTRSTSGGATRSKDGRRGPLFGR